MQSNGDSLLHRPLHVSPAENVYKGIGIEGGLRSNISTSLFA
jgi:hypothetical protein